MRKHFALLLCLTLLLSIFALSVPVNAGEEITDFVDYETQDREMTTFNIFHTHSAVDFNILTNSIDGLLTHDNYGRILPNIAEEWGTDDNGITWTFKIRDGVKWVDYNANVKADVVAEDWVWGMEWVLNFHKNDAYNTSMPIEMIKGAKEYYEYTKGLEYDEAVALGLDKFKEMVGVEAVDDHTLKYTLVDHFPYFATLATYACLYPVSGQLLEEIGVEGFKGVTNETLWYSGPYTVTTFVHQNEKVLTANPEYWNKETKRFNTITIKMVESPDVAYQLFQTGEVDRVTLTEANLMTIYNNPNHEFHKYLTETRPSVTSMQIHFNYDKRTPEGEKDVNWNTAVANKAFRQVWYYGLDLTPALSRINAINPIGVANYTYSSGNLVQTSDGRDYKDLVLERLGITPSPDKLVRLDPEKAAELKKQAMEELSAKGVEFPVVCDLYIKSGNQSEADTATVFKQMFTDCFGDDFIVLNIKEYVSSLNKEVRDPQLASIYLNGWSPDYGDPISNLAQETYGEDNAFYSTIVSKINTADDPDLIATYKEYTKMVRDAAAINDDMDARYNGFADAEAFFLENALTIPYYQSVAWQLSCVNVYSRVYSPYGIQVNRHVNWETNKDIYTTEEYKEIREAFEAGKAK